MAADALEIANLALSLIGEAPITVLDNTTPAGRACNLHYLPVRDALLRSHPWNFAQVRVALAPAPVTELTCGTTSTSTAVTTTALGLLVGQSVTGTGIPTGATITVVNAGVGFTLSAAATVTDAANALTFGVYWSDVTLPAFGWTYAYALPAACLAVTEINDLPVTDARTDYVIEGRKILTDSATCNLSYTSNAAAVSTYDPLFVEILTLKLGIAIADRITQSKSKAAELTQQLERISGPLARKRDANEDRRPRVLDYMDSDAIRARYASSYL